MKRIVVKVGTSTLTHENGEPNLRSIDMLARTLSELQNMDYDVVLVSSGAIAVGQCKMKLEKRPEELRLKQATAAVGQCELMHLYDKFFGEYGKIVGQILLTGEDIENTHTKENIINTLEALLEQKIIPIVNENDTVSYEEIENPHKIFGDNDTLSAIVAVLCEADILVLLSDIDGLYEDNPAKNPDARLIREVRVLDEEIRDLASGAGSNRGTGGMITKLNAAEIAMNKGINMVISNGKYPEKLYDIVEGKAVGTLFVAKK